MTHSLRWALALLILSLALAGCGGSSGDTTSPTTPPANNDDTGTDTDTDTDTGTEDSNDTDSEAPDTQAGVFSDSPIAGVAYLTSPSELEGITNSAGEYEFREGDEVDFRIGGIAFPRVQAKKLVTPLDMGGEGADLSSPVVLNIIRLLQTLDDDGDPENGINIPEATSNALMDSDIVFDADTESFELQASTALSELDTELVTEEDAVAHFEGALKTSLLGSWIHEEEAGGRSLLTFFGDDRYVLVHSHTDGGNQPAGAGEFGRYAWDPVNGDFLITELIRASNNGGGLYDPNDPSRTRTLTVDDGALTLHHDDSSTEFTAVRPEGLGWEWGEDLVGAWYLPEQECEHDLDGGLLITFLNENEYVLVHTWNVEAYGGGTPVRVTSEWNTYSWSSDDENFSVGIPAVDLDGPGGFYNASGNEDVDDPRMYLSGYDLRYQYNPSEAIHFGPVAPFEAVLEDAQGDIATAPVRRRLGTFYNEVDATYHIPKVDKNAGEEGTFEIVRLEDHSVLSLNADGTGTIDHGDSNENSLTWWVTTTGVLSFDESDGDSSWYWTVTPIKGKSGNSAHVDVMVPAGQEGTGSLSYIVPVMQVHVDPEPEGDIVFTFTDDIDGWDINASGGNTETDNITIEHDVDNHSMVITPLDWDTDNWLLEPRVTIPETDLSGAVVTVVLDVPEDYIHDGGLHIQLSAGNTYFGYTDHLNVGENTISATANDASLETTVGIQLVAPPYDQSTLEPIAVRSVVIDLAGNE